jgi:hypothetical protein
MANETNGTKYPTWAWVAAVFLGIIMLLIGAGLTNMSNTISTHAAQLQAKVDRETYHNDIADIKANVSEIRKDVKELVWQVNKAAKR